MDETIKNTATEELNKQETLVEEEVTTAEQRTDEDPLKVAVEEQLKKIQRQNLLIGAQTVCRVILEKIYAAESKPGKRTMNDYKRLIKDIKQFCTTGISRKVNADGETEPIKEESTTEETVQN
jgi:hypothetical protein